MGDADAGQLPQAPGALAAAREEKRVLLTAAGRAACTPAVPRVNTIFTGFKGLIKGFVLLRVLICLETRVC